MLYFKLACKAESTKGEIWVPVRAITIYEAIRKAYQICAPVDLLVHEQSLQQISYHEYERLLAVFSRRKANF